MLRQDSEVTVYQIECNYENKGKWSLGIYMDWLGSLSPTHINRDPKYTYGPCGEVWQTYGLYGTQDLLHAVYLLEKAIEKAESENKNHKFRIAKRRFVQETLQTLYWE